VSLADEARVSLMLADFANADATGKLNIIGGGWQVTARLSTGMTPPICVIARVEVPASHYGEQIAWSMSLLGEAGDVVSLPGPSGELQALRIQQLAKVEKPNVPGLFLPPNSLRSQVQVVLNFSGGLLLAPGAYSWLFEIDGNEEPHWNIEFVVLGPPAQPVIG
jgi:hypothetical protein